MKNQFVSKDKTELCVLCRKDTGVSIFEDVNKRFGYVEGVGQLCSTCSSKL